MLVRTYTRDFVFEYQRNILRGGRVVCSTMYLGGASRKASFPFPLAAQEKDRLLVRERENTLSFRVLTFE